MTETDQLYRRIHHGLPDSEDTPKKSQTQGYVDIIRGESDAQDS